jgi:hypothetical protein
MQSLPPQVSYEDGPGSTVPITFDTNEQIEEDAVVIRSRKQLRYWSVHRGLSPTGAAENTEKELEEALAKALRVDAIDWSMKMVVAAVARYHRWQGVFEFSPPRLEGDTLCVSWTFDENPTVQKTFRYAAVALVDRHDGPVAFRPPSGQPGRLSVALTRSGNAEPALPTLNVLPPVKAGDETSPGRSMAKGTLALLPLTLPVSPGHGIDAIICHSSDRNVVAPLEVVRGQPGPEAAEGGDGVTVLLRAGNPGRLRLTVRVQYTVFVESPIIVDLEVL